MAPDGHHRRPRRPTSPAAPAPAGLARVGAMVEVPAAALHADRLLAELDFLSIGTNDLSQYTFAADRQHGEPRRPARPLAARAAAAWSRCAPRPGGPRASRWACAARPPADPLLATVLVGLGVTSLSMSARSVPAVRDALARHTLAECRRNAELALAAPDPEAARAAVRAAG